LEWAHIAKNILSVAWYVGQQNQHRLKDKLSDSFPVC
jgi:hypothetical protein